MLPLYFYYLQLNAARAALCGCFASRTCKTLLTRINFAKNKKHPEFASGSVPHHTNDFSHKYYGGTLCWSRKRDHFLDPKSRPQNYQPCTRPDTYLVGPGGSELFSTVGPNRARWDGVGPSSSLRGTKSGSVGTRPHDNRFHCLLALQSRCESVGVCNHLGGGTANQR